MLPSLETVLPSVETVVPSPLGYGKGEVEIVSERNNSEVWQN
jgi:hypothetical protein